MCIGQVFDLDGQTVDLTTPIGGPKIVLNELQTEVYSCLGLAGNDTDRLKQLTRVVK